MHQGKKQKMFMGVPTFHGKLRFADVSHLTDATDYDVDIVWGGDGPKDELPSGRAQALLRDLLCHKDRGIQVRGHYSSLALPASPLRVATGAVPRTSRPLR